MWMQLLDGKLAVGFYNLARGANRVQAWVLWRRRFTIGYLPCTLSFIFPLTVCLNLTLSSGIIRRRGGGTSSTKAVREI